MIIMSVIMVGMSYQMPVGVGIIQGGGDTKFSMYLNLISVWCIVMPLSFLAAFYWKLPVEPCGDCCSIRSDFQMPAHIPALQKLQMDPQADGNRLMQ